MSSIPPAKVTLQISKIRHISPTTAVNDAATLSSLAPPRSPQSSTPITASPLDSSSMVSPLPIPPIYTSFENNLVLPCYGNPSNKFQNISPQDQHLTYKDGLRIGSIDHAYQQILCRRLVTLIMPINRNCAEDWWH